MPADQLQALLAPYLNASSAPSGGSPSQVGTQFGGLGQLGAALLAANTPSPVRQPLGALLGKSVLASQDNALSAAKSRQELASNAIQMQNNLSLLAMLSNPQGASAATGLPIDAPDGSSGPGDNSQPPQGAAPPGAAPSAAPVAVPGASPNAIPAALIQRLAAAKAGVSAPPGAGGTPPGVAPLNAPQAAPAGLPGGVGSPMSAAPPGAPAVQRQQIAPPGGSGQLPPGFNPYARATAPTGAAPAVTTSLPKWWAPPTAAQISGVPIGGIPPALLQRIALMRGQDPGTTAKGIREQQLQVAKQEYAPALAQIDTLTKSDTPTKYVKADPTLMAGWQQIAPQLGMDPNKDFTDQNVRTAFTFERNRLAGAVSEAPVAPNVQLKTTPFGVGGSIQTDPVTGKISTGAPQQDTKAFVLPDGSVQEMPTATGMARGLPPFNAETYINPTTVGGTASMIAGYKMAPLTAQAMRTAQGQAIMAQVRTLNPSYDATQYSVKQDAREAFATGTQGNTVRSLSVATDHLNQLGQAATALSQNNLPAVNAAMNYVATQTGNPNVKSFEAMKEVVGDEVVKAVVGSSGAEGDRDAIKNAFAAASSPQQVQAVIQKYKGLMGSQLKGLQRQYQKSTGLDDFNDMVAPEAGAELTGSSSGGPIGVGQTQTIGGFKVTRTQ